MLKRIISLLITLVIVASSITLTVSAETTQNGTITVYYNGVKLKENVVFDENGAMFVPMSWLTYYGLLRCKENSDEYEFYYPEQYDLDQYAKRIFISKSEPYNLFVGYYFTNDGLVDELATRYSSFSKAKNYSESKKASTIQKHFKKSFKPGKSTDKQVRENFITIYDGELSKGLTVDSKLYFPFEELLPLINAKVGVSEDGSLCVSINNSSILRALYGNKIGENIFDADECVKVGKGFIDATSWVTSTILNLRFDRLDFIYKTGEVNDYQTVFEEMLLDDEVYLSTQDPESGKNEVELTNELLSGLSTAVSTLDKMNISGENKHGVDTDILSTINKTLYSDSFVIDNIGNAKKATGYVSDVCNYWYIYNYQVNDHRDMLGSVYDYVSSKGVKDKNDYSSIVAAKSIQAQYDDTFSTATISKLGDVFFDEALSKAANNQMTKKLFGSLLSSIEVTTSILSWIDSTKEAMETMDSGVNINYYDKIADTAYKVFSDVLYTQECDEDALQRLRLSAILALIASKNGFGTDELFGDIYEDEVDDINELLRKLYLAADGTECESSSYYDEKKYELSSTVGDLVVDFLDSNNDEKADTDNSDYSIYTNEQYGWSVQLPDEWLEYGSYEEHDLGTSFHHTEVRDESQMGHLFTIQAIELNSEHDDKLYGGMPKGGYLGENSEYAFYWWGATDVQVDMNHPDFDRIASEMDILDSYQTDILDSFTLTND